MNSLNWILTTVLAVAFGGAGLAKATGRPAMRVVAARLGYSTGQFRTIGVLEVAGVLGIIAGTASANFRAIGVAAAIGLAAIGVGAAASHLRVGDRRGAAAPSVLGLLSAANAVVMLAR